MYVEKIFTKFNEVLRRFSLKLKRGGKESMAYKITDKCNKALDELRQNPEQYAELKKRLSTYNRQKNMSDVLLARKRTGRL